MQKNAKRLIVVKKVKEFLFSIIFVGLTEEELQRLLMESDEELNYSELDDESDNDENQSNSINDCQIPTTSATHKNVNTTYSKFAKPKYELSSDSDDLSSAEDDDDEVSPNNFVWKSDPDFIPKLHTFLSENCGATDTDLRNGGILDCFQKFFTSDTLAKIVEETNRYANQLTANETLKKASRLQKYREVKEKDIYCFLAVSLLMVRTKKLSFPEYWSTDPLIKTPIFSEIMSRDRYLLILRVLHFNNNEQQNKNDPLFKIRPIFDLIKKNSRKILFHSKICA